jgi:hypothetical protein
MPHSKVATVLYEDQRGPTNRFGLHDFIMRCACDACDVPEPLIYKAIGLVDGVAKKGNAKLLEAIRRDLKRIAADGRAVHAVFDNDRVRTLLQLPGASEEQVTNAITTGCPTEQVSLHITLLKENTESILQTARECGAEGPDDSDTFDRAINRKEPVARDIVFTNISKTNAKTIRDCILEKLPSLASLIGRIADLIRPLSLSDASPQQ